MDGFYIAWILRIWPNNIFEQNTNHMNLKETTPPQKIKLKVHLYSVDQLYFLPTPGYANSRRLINGRTPIL